MATTAHTSIALLYDIAERFDTWDEPEHGDEPRRADRISEQLLLLATLTESATPLQLVDHLLTFDLPDPELAAAYRLLREAAFDLPAARAAAVHPDVAGVLDTVATYARIWSGSQPHGLRWAELLWERRRRLLEADRLRWVASQIARSDLTGFAALDEANRAIDAAFQRLGAAPSGAGPEPPGGLPDAMPTARRRLLDATSTDVMLADEAIATALVELIEVADRRVLLAVPWIRPSSVFDRLLVACRQRLAHGARVLAVTRPVQMSSSHPAAAASDRDAKRALVEAGVQVRWRKHLHDKVFVVDDTVICGSQNLTGADIDRNPNAAIGSGTPATVEAFAARIEQLGEPTSAATPQRIADAQLPVFAYDAGTAVSHRLDIPGDADLGLLEGGGRARADCGDEVEVDHLSRIWAFDYGQPCLDCRPPLA